MPSYRFDWYAWILSFFPDDACRDVFDFGKTDRTESPVSIPRLIRLRPEIVSDCSLKVLSGTCLGAAVSGLYSNLSPYVIDVASQINAFSCTRSPALVPISRLRARRCGDTRRRPPVSAVMKYTFAYLHSRRSKSLHSRLFGEDDAFAR